MAFLSVSITGGPMGGLSVGLEISDEDAAAITNLVAQAAVTGMATAAGTPTPQTDPA